MSETAVVAVLDALSGDGIGHVVSGGWGIDALLGVQTREHRDLDVGVDAAFVDDAVVLLVRLGYSVAADERPARLELRAADGRTVDLHPIDWSQPQNGRQQGSNGLLFEYPAHDIVEGRVGRRNVPCISATLQRKFHSGYEPGERDRADLAALERGLLLRQSGA